MKKLYIAEKPDIGRAIAGYLWPDGKYQKTRQYFQKGDTTVTWAYGHILALADPVAYGPEYRLWRSYPIIPHREQWILQPTSATQHQFSCIQQLLQEHDVVIHAGDPDREGQLLVEEILRYCKYQGRVGRILINAKDDESLKRAFNSIVDNKKYENLYYAGLARELADWLVGMNLSRCYTINAAKAGHQNVFRIGRVKVPTLALVVNREKEILNFKSVSYYELKATFQKDAAPFSCTLVPKEELCDSEGRVLDRSLIEAIEAKVRPEDGIIQTVEKKKGTKNPPLPYSLDSLQVEANRRFKISPKDVLDTVQKLYENKLVSYPRSDCNYIPLSQKADAARILPTLAKYGISGVDKADTALTSKAWNDKKVTAHHAIIPTGVMPGKLHDLEEKIYKLIADRYLLQFFKPCTFATTSFTLQIAEEVFKGSGRVILDPGYTILYKDEDSKKEDNPVLPPLKKGENVGTPTSLTINDKKTNPPKRFTEGTLLAAMANIWKFMDPKNPNRDKLKEVKGIGTPATRDTIISDLQIANIKGKPALACIKKVKNELVPTEFGTMLIENVEQSLTKPDTTAEMEYTLTEIAEGKSTIDKYLAAVEKMVTDNISFAENRQFPLAEGHTPRVAVANRPRPCPICGTGQLTRKYSPKTKKSFWMCSNQKCVNPATGKVMFYDERADGEPMIAKCIGCGTLMNHYNGRNGPFWSCPKCKRTFKG